jgi:predicted GTPase
VEEDSDSEDEGSQVITPVEALRAIEKNSFNKLSDKEKEKARRSMADELIRAALDDPDEEEDGMVPEEKQRSLRVGIIGAVNAGKSTLTNFMV